MKNLSIPIDHLVMLAELDDKDAGLMAKAIAQRSSTASLYVFPALLALAATTVKSNQGWSLIRLT